MEYCGGGSLLDIMKICDSSLREDEIRQVCKEVVAALQYLHGNQRIHRDIKAANILLTLNGISKLGMRMNSCKAISE